MTTTATPPPAQLIRARARYVAKAIAAAVAPILVTAGLALADELAGVGLDEPWHTLTVVVGTVLAVYRTPNGAKP